MQILRPNLEVAGELLGHESDISFLHVGYYELPYRVSSQYSLRSCLGFYVLMVDLAV